MPKPWWSSRTIWANLVSLVATVATVAGVGAGLDTGTQAEIVAGVTALTNVGLRLVTRVPVE